MWVPVAVLVAAVDAIGVLPGLMSGGARDAHGAGRRGRRRFPAFTSRALARLHARAGHEPVRVRRRAMLAYRLQPRLDAVRAMLPRPDGKARVRARAGGAHRDLAAAQRAPAYGIAVGLSRRDRVRGAGRRLRRLLHCDPRPGKPADAAGQLLAIVMWALVVGSVPRARRATRRPPAVADRHQRGGLIVCLSSCSSRRPISR